MQSLPISITQEYSVSADTINRLDSIRHRLDRIKVRL